jgi:hypothetical protein
LRYGEYTINPRINHSSIKRAQAKELPSRMLKPTFECEEENYPYIQMIISTLLKWNPNIISLAFSCWDIKILRQP